ncbi:hypothetical protein NL676_005846 [Syzygium grande]|nr:hypothetical protein NL676_005846 [Syzygium grande]
MSQPHPTNVSHATPPTLLFLSRGEDVLEGRDADSDAFPGAMAQGAQPKRVRSFNWGGRDSCDPRCDSSSARIVIVGVESRIRTKHRRSVNSLRKLVVRWGHRAPSSMDISLIQIQAGHTLKPYSPALPTKPSRDPTGHNLDTPAPPRSAWRDLIRGLRNPGPTGGRGGSRGSRPDGVSKGRGAGGGKFFL